MRTHLDDDFDTRRAMQAMNMIAFLPVVDARLALVVVYGPMRAMLRCFEHINSTVINFPLYGPQFGRFLFGGRLGGWE